jgi:hypothetical protein
MCWRNITILGGISLYGGNLIIVESESWMSNSKSLVSPNLDINTSETSAVLAEIWCKWGPDKWDNLGLQMSALQTLPKTEGNAANQGQCVCLVEPKKGQSFFRIY